jgi:type VI secretion system secreted protein VgrG
MSGTDDDGSSGYVTVAVTPKPAFNLVFDGMTVAEEMGSPFLIELDMSSGTARGEIESTLGSSVTVTMTDATNKKTYFNGIIARAAFTGLSGGAYRYHIEVRPAVWLLTRKRDCRIFQNMSVWDIVNTIFKDNGFDVIDDKRQNQAGSTVLEYCVQYRESCFDFVLRLMEEYGLYFYFEHTPTEHKLVFADDPNSHTSIGKAIPFSYGQTEQRTVDDHVWELTSDLNVTPGAHTTTDYNFTTPSADLTTKALAPGEHPYGNFEIFDYPGLYDTVADGQKLADVRMQAHKAQMQIIDGRSNARGIRVGSKFSLEKTADSSMEKEYLVIRTKITLTLAEGASGTEGKHIDSHRVSFSAIPGSTPFRLEQKTPRPVIAGPQTAKVVGESGQEITTDQYGRIKVKFNWDRAPGADENSSCWIRVAQTWAGLAWGSMFIPRIGMEVVVVFLEGNPDRPLVTGVVYNANQTVPYALPDNKTRSTIKSNSSTGGSGFNELRFEDKAGSEEVFFQAQKDFNKTVLNNETSTITQDCSTTVKQGNHSLTVSQGNQSVTVSQGNHSLSISTGGSKTSTGQAIEMTANTSIKLTATTSIELTVGSNSIKIDQTGVTISGVKISGSATAQMALDGGAMMELTGGIIKIN